MKLKRFKNVVLCSVVTSMLLASSVTYGQGAFYYTEENQVEVVEEDRQLVVKPGHEVIEIKVGDVLNHELLKEQVMFDDGSILPEGYTFEPIFLAGEKLFNEGVALKPGKASIRVKVKETSHDYSAITQACMTVIIKEDCKPEEPEIPEIPDEVVSHMPYIYGYEDGTFRADRGVSREELASMVSRLILQGGYPAYKNPYTDLNDERYSANHVGHLEALGIMKGYGDSTFHPHEKITRGEMAAVIKRTVETLGIGPVAARTMHYVDVNANHWAYDSIRFVTENGYMEGKENGEFLPDQPLSRAEAVITLNKVFDRVCDDAEINNPYSDLDRNHWAYIDILYASVVHEHKITQ